MLKNNIKSLERSVLGLLKTELNKEVIALKKLKAEIEKRQKSIKISRKQLSETLASEAPGRLVLAIPFLGRSRQRQFLAEVEDQREALNKKMAFLKKDQEKIRNRGNQLEKFKFYSSWIRKVSELISLDGVEPDIEIETAVSRFDLRIESLKKSSRYSKSAELLKILSEERVILNTWIEEQARLIREKARAVPRARTAQLIAPQAPKVFIPAPVSMADDLKAAGFRVDKKVRVGSPVYFDPTKDMDLAKRMQPLLPLAARQHRPKFSFQEIAFEARSQNLHQVFDKEGWRIIRGKLVSSTGMRCAVCGSQGGRLLEYLPDEAHKKEAVECHEVWSWTVLDEAKGIGVQRLEDIMVVCIDCHAMFHEGQMLSRISRTGADQEEVRNFLRERMAQVTGQTLHDINHQRQIEISDRRDLSGLDTWILDLEFLEDHQYLKGSTPVLQANNPAGVTPDLVAGTGFLDESGEFYEARSADEIYKSLILEIEFAQNLLASPI